MPTDNRKPNIAFCRDKMREIITFFCSECKNRNYTSWKDKKKTKDKLELNKYCRFCRKHTLHKELK